MSTRLYLLPNNSSVITCAVNIESPAYCFSFTQLEFPGMPAVNREKSGISGTGDIKKFDIKPADSLANSTLRIKTRYDFQGLTDTDWKAHFRLFSDEELKQVWKEYKKYREASNNIKIANLMRIYFVVTLSDGTMPVDYSFDPDDLSWEPKEGKVLSVEKRIRFVHSNIQTPGL